MSQGDQIIRCEKGGPALTCPDVMLPVGWAGADFGAVRRSQGLRSREGAAVPELSGSMPPSEIPPVNTLDCLSSSPWNTRGSL